MIKDAILAQKAELESKAQERYIQRDADASKLSKDIIKVIIGPRRAGKSSFAIHSMPKPFGYANFDDERLIGARDYDEILAAINSVYGNPKNLLLDEIQNLDKWELFVNRLQRQGYNLTITGSNSNLLSRELSTHLTGRYMDIGIYPFSFREFLLLGKKDLTEAEKKAALSEYLSKGGYPEPAVKGLDYREYLSTLFGSVIYKDIISRHKVRYPRSVDNLASYLLSNASREFSYKSLAKIAGATTKTAEKYVSYLEEAFIIFRVGRFSWKLKEQFSWNKKAYCVDSGMALARSFSVSPDLGRLYENAVAAELKRRRAEFYYWKNQSHEVDFVIKEGSAIGELIQVCYDESDPKTKERETRALLAAGKELSCKNLKVITSDYEAEEKVSWFGASGIVKYVPLWKWLLD